MVSSSQQGWLGTLEFWGVSAVADHMEADWARLAAVDSASKLPASIGPATQAGVVDERGHEFRGTADEVKGAVTDWLHSCLSSIEARWAVSSDLTSRPAIHAVYYHDRVEYVPGVVEFISPHSRRFDVAFWGCVWRPGAGSQLRNLRAGRSVRSGQPLVCCCILGSGGLYAELLSRDFGGTEGLIP